MAEVEQEPQEQEQVVREAVRHGSRWLHRHPTEEQVREWFKNQTLHEEMPHDPYVGGIVVIGSTDKPKITKFKANGDPYTAEVEVAVFTPYVKVDTRVAYFWDLVRAMNEKADDDKYIGVIEPVPQPRITKDTSPYYNEHMPEGFSALAVRNGDSESFNRYFLCTQRVAIYERESYARVLNGQKAMPVLQGTGTKQVPTSKRFADDNAIMKAETGAVGRALGMAGILVVGTGVATAEDMQEAQQNASAPSVGGPEAGMAPPAVVSHAQQVESGAPAPQASAAVPDEQTPEGEDDDLRQQALGLQRVLAASHPEVWKAYQAWWKGRSFGPISELSGPALKGAVIKLERDLEAANTAAAGGDDPAPADTPPGEG